MTRCYFIIVVILSVAENLSVLLYLAVLGRPKWHE